MEQIRVVIAEDTPWIRQIIRHELQQAADIEVVAEARDGLEAVENVNRLLPDILLLDMQLPALDGVGVLQAISATKPEVMVLVLSAFDDKEFILGVLSYGAAGYILKDEYLGKFQKADLLADAIHRVAKGEKGIFSERIRLIIEGLS